MKSLSLLGILLVVLGALALAYQGINYTHREKIVAFRADSRHQDTQEHIPLPPILGGLALAGRSGPAGRWRKAKSLTEVFGWGWLVSATAQRAPPAHGVP